MRTAFTACAAPWASPSLRVGPQFPSVLESAIVEVACHCEIVHDLVRRVAAGRLSLRFHSGLGRAITRTSAPSTGLDRVRAHLVRNETNPRLTPSPGHRDAPKCESVASLPNAYWCARQWNASASNRRSAESSTDLDFCADQLLPAAATTLARPTRSSFRTERMADGRSAASDRRPDAGGHWLGPSTE